MSESFSRRSIRYSLSVLATAKRSSDFLLYKRSEQLSKGPARSGQRRDGALPPAIPQVSQSYIYLYIYLYIDR